MISPLNVIGMTRISQESLEDLEIAGFDFYTAKDHPDHVEEGEVHITAGAVNVIYRLQEDGIWEQTSLIVSGKILIKDSAVIKAIYEYQDEFKDGEEFKLNGETILVRVVPDENGTEDYFFW